MREMSVPGPITVRAVAGTYVVLLGMNVDPTQAAGLLGFGIERTDHTEGEQHVLSNALLFAANDVGAKPDFSSTANPIQEFVWGDYTAKPDHRYTYRVTAMHGTPTAPAPGVSTEVQIRTENPDDGTHGVYFNRGVVASQAYQQRFGTRAPATVPNREAYIWLSRGLEDAVRRFIGQANGPRFALRAAFSEFNWSPVLTALRVAADSGADVQVVVHEVPKAKDTTPQRNREAIAANNITALCVDRTRTTIAHNKFVVLLRDGVPEQVWTGSTNITEGGIFGHANVGHRITSRRVAERYLDYWTQLKGNPDRGPIKDFNDPTPRFPAGRPRRGTPASVFSARSTLAPLEWYCRLADSATQGVFLTAAFGLTPEIAPVFDDHRDYLRYLLLDLQSDNVKAVRREPGNVVAAGGDGAKGGFRQWIARGLKNLNGFVDYVHTKFMLVDPLTSDPIVITGSANWSDESVKNNDENMLVIRGDTRVADIYLTEFMRLFNHYRLRGKAGAPPGQLEPGVAATPHERARLHLAEDDSWAARFFIDGSPEAKERLLFGTEHA